MHAVLNIRTYSLKTHVLTMSSNKKTPSPLPPSMLGANFRVGPRTHAPMAVSAACLLHTDLHLATRLHCLGEQLVSRDLRGPIAAQLLARRATVLAWKIQMGISAFLCTVWRNFIIAPILSGHTLSGYRLHPGARFRYRAHWIAEAPLSWACIVNV